MAGIVEHMLFGKQYLGIELFSSGTEDRFALLEVQRRKGELVIVKNEVHSLDQLQKSKLPACLVINNSQVLQKEVDSTEANDRKLLNKAFPNLNLNDFYFEVVRFDERSVIALCRKSYVEQQIKALENRFRIVSFSLGISTIQVLRGFSLPEHVATASQQIDFGNPQTIMQPAIVDQEEIYNINGLEISNKYLLSFGCIIKLLLKSEHSSGNISELNTILQEEYKQKTLFEKGLKAALIIILTLLLVNFFAFSYYFDKVQSLKQTASIDQAGMASIAKLKHSIKDKQQRLKDFTAQSLSKSAWAINELVKDMPSSILLSEITYCPLEKKIKESEPIQFTEKLITISGSTLNNEAFTDWIGKIEKMGWIDKVTIQSFGRNTENSTVFELKIALK